MAGSVPVKPAAASPCCQAWKDKCLKSEEARVALRKTINILQSVVNKFEADNASLKKAYEDKQARASIEKESKEKESSMRALLENEVSSLKSEIAVLQSKLDASDGNEELKLLKIRVSDGEKEINWLKELLEKEKLRADLEKEKAEKDKVEEIYLLEARVSEGEKEISQLKELVEREKLRADEEKKIAEVEKKKATERQKYVKAEKANTYEEKKVAQIEKKMAEEYRMQLEALRNEASEAKSELHLETSKVEELTKKLEVVNNKLEAEKRKTVKQRERADSEMAKAKEQRKLAVANTKKAKEELLRAENLSLELEEARRGILELQKEIDDQKAISKEIEKTKVDEERKASQFEGKKAEDHRMQLEALRNEASEAKHKLLSENSKLEELTKKLEVEEQKTMKEQKRADSEMVEAGEQRKLAEVNRKKAEEEQLRAENLSLQLEEARRIIEEQRKEMDDQKVEKVQVEVAQNKEYEPEDFKMQLEALRNKASEAKIELLSKTSKLEEVMEKLEAEKQKTIKKKKRADSEMLRAEEQRNLAEVNRKKAEEEQLRAENIYLQLEEARRGNMELQKEVDGQKAIINKAENSRMEFEALRKEAGEAKIELLSKTSKLEEVMEKLEAEKQKTIKKKKRADSEMLRAEEQRNLAEVNRKKAEEEQLRAENIYLQLEEARRDNMELQKEVDGQKAIINKAENSRMEFEALRKEAGEAKSKLLSQTSKLEEMIKKLEAEKQKTIKETKRADSEMVKAEKQRKLAEVNRNKAEEEQLRAENIVLQLEEARRGNMELRKEVDGQKAIINKATNSRMEFEALRKEASEAKSKLLSQTPKLEEVIKKLEAEKQRTIKERKCADSEMANAEEQRKLAEVNMKKAEGEKLRAGNLSLQLKKARRRIEELQKEIDDQQDSNKEDVESDMVKMEEHKKLAEITRKIALEEKCRADCLSEQLKEATLKVEDMQKRICELSSSGRVVETFAIPPDKDRDAEIAAMKILKKELKFEKKRVKHAKQVAKLERRRNDVLQDELSRLKLEFVQFSYRLTLLDNRFSPSLEGINHREKAEDSKNMQWSKLKKKLTCLKPSQMQLQKGNERQNPSCNIVTTFDPLQKGHQCSELLTPTSRGNYCESISGIDSELESLLGCSNRKSIKSYGKNSHTASISNRGLVGSQDKGAFSVTTSTKMTEENLATVADNCVGRSHHINLIHGVNRHSKKRKRVLDTIESIESLCSKDKKWHLQLEEKLSVLHDMLVRKEDKPVKERSSHGKHSRVHKKRKTSHEAEVVMRHVDDSDNLNIGKLNTVVHENSNRCGEASQPSNNLIGTGLACGEGVCDSVANGFKARICFEEVANGDYMKLLDLDNASDEEYYRTVMKMPLSPTLPEIEFQLVEDFGIDDLESLLERGTHKKVSNRVDNLPPSCGVNVVNDKLDSDKFRSSGSEISHNSLLHQNEGPLGSFDTTTSRKTCVSRKWNSEMEMEMEMSVIPTAAEDKMKIPFGSEPNYKHKSFPKYCVIFSNMKDQSTTFKIFHATKTCMDRCALVHQTGWALQNILLAVKMEENLLVQEKACVFFSLLLLKLSITLGKYESFLNGDFRSCLDAFACHLSGVMYDAEGRTVIADIFCSLLSLIGDFLSDGRIVYADTSSETHVRFDSRINIVLDGMNLILSNRLASSDTLVAGSVILASVCATSDHLGFLCEVSCNMFLMHSYDMSILVTILHVFAYLGGQNFFTLRSYGLAITVLKSAVTYLEKRHLDVTLDSCYSSSSEVRSEFHPCATCPFSEGAVSVDYAISFLFETLQSYAQSGTMNQGKIKTSNSGALSNMHKTGLTLRHEKVDSVFDTNCDASCSISKWGVCSMQPEPVKAGTSCHFIDILSLIELLAATMGCDWICEKIVAPLLKILESSMAENLSVAIVILLGQLGRRAVDSGGYEDKGVKDLINKLTAFLQREATIRGGLPIQIATVSALLRLISLDFNQVMESQVALSVDTGLSDTTDLIRKWFSLLSNEQQAFLRSLLKCPGGLTPEQI